MLQPSGLTELQLGSLRTAEIQLTKALQLNSELPGARRALASVCLRVGRAGARLGRARAGAERGPAGRRHAVARRRDPVAHGPPRQGRGAVPPGGTGATGRSADPHGAGAGAHRQGRDRRRLLRSGGTGQRRRGPGRRPGADHRPPAPRRDRRGDPGGAATDGQAARQAAGPSPDGPDTAQPQEPARSAQGIRSRDRGRCGLPARGDRTSRRSIRWSAGRSRRWRDSRRCSSATRRTCWRCCRSPRSRSTCRPDRSRPRPRCRPR
ncbi:MAG: hypothetical protein MZW92_21125 [Comamonadaceae bacterium]|nr:hypothetical protein [Comamonadaceae bacterium]